MRKKERSVQGLLEETCKQKDRRILELEKELQESKKGFETLKEAIETLKEVIAMTDYWKKELEKEIQESKKFFETLIMGTISARQHEMNMW